MDVDARGMAYPDLDDVARRFAQWRRKRRGRARIPDDLWRFAAEAAAAHGVGVTVRRLGLNASRLKEWMQVVEHESASSGSETAFIELPPLAMGSSGECVLELEEPSGRKLRVTLRGPAIGQALQLGRALWEGE